MAYSPPPREKRIPPPSTIIKKTIKLGGGGGRGGGLMCPPPPLQLSASLFLFHGLDSIIEHLALAVPKIDNLYQDMVQYEGAVTRCATGGPPGVIGTDSLSRRTTAPIGAGNGPATTRRRAGRRTKMCEGPERSVDNGGWRRQGRAVDGTTSELRGRGGRRRTQ